MKTLQTATVSCAKKLVSVEGNKSLPLIWSPAVLPASIGGLLSWWPFKPQHRVSYRGLISSVLPAKDPWPPGLCRPCIDLSLVLLFQPSCPEYSFSLALLLIFLMCRAGGSQTRMETSGPLF